MQAVATADDAEVSEVQPVDLFLFGAFSHDHAIMICNSLPRKQLELVE